MLSLWLIANFFVLGSEPAGIEVLLKFDHTPSVSTLESMQRETTEIFRSAGIPLRWRLLGKHETAAATSNSVLIRFKGWCHCGLATLSDPIPSGESATVGRSAVSGGHVLPVAEVHCDEVQKVLPPTTGKARASVFGVAMGRVVAHELYHIAADTLGHGKEGLGKHSVSAQDLSRGRSQFSPEDLDLLKRPYR
jgi:hypothetical protein